MYKHWCQKFIKQTHHFKKKSDTQPSTGINDKITNNNNTNEEISCHQKPAEVIDYIYNDNVNIVLNIEEEKDITSIHYINKTNDMSMNDDDNFIHEYYAPFLSWNNHEYASCRS